MKKMSYIIALLAFTIVLVVGLYGCANLPEEMDSPDVGLEIEEILPSEPEEPEYIPEPAEVTPVRFDVINLTGSLTVSDIAIVCADMEYPGGISLPDAMPPDSSWVEIEWYPADVRVPAISFMYETDSSSGSAAFVFPGSSTLTQEDFPEHPHISVRFSERDWLYAQVRSNLWQGGEQSVQFRYFPELGQWLPAQDRQRLFVAQVEPELLRELYPATQWDSPHPAIVLFADEPIIDLSFSWYVSENPQSQELTLSQFDTPTPIDILLPGQYIIAPYPLRWLHAQHREINGVVHTQWFSRTERGGHFPLVATGMVDQSWTVVWYNEEVPQPPVYNSAFERAVESRNIGNIDDSSPVVIIEYESMSREELDQIENLERFDAGDGHRFVVIPRYENSDIIINVLMHRSFGRGWQPDEILHRSQNTPQNYAMVITAPMPSNEVPLGEREMVGITVEGGGFRVRHDSRGRGPDEVFFLVSVLHEPRYPEYSSWIESFRDVPLANGVMLRCVWPPHSEASEYVVILEDGQRIDLDGGERVFLVWPRVSPERDMIAVRLSRVLMSEYNSLFLFDTNTQVYRELETDGPMGGLVPSWSYWLDNSHLLVGSGWPSRYLIDAHAYVYIVEEGEFFRLFESGSYAQIRWARVEGDKMIVTYAVAVCFGWRTNSYEERERTFPMSEVWAMIDARQSYMFEWDAQLGPC